MDEQPRPSVCVQSLQSCLKPDGSSCVSAQVVCRCLPRACAADCTPSIARAGCTAQAADHICTACTACTAGHGPGDVIRSEALHGGAGVHPPRSLGALLQEDAVQVRAVHGAVQAVQVESMRYRSGTHSTGDAVQVRHLHLRLVQSYTICSINGDGDPFSSLVWTVQFLCVARSPPKFGAVDLSVPMYGPFGSAAGSCGI